MTRRKASPQVEFEQIDSNVNDCFVCIASGMAQVSLECNISAFLRLKRNCFDVQSFYSHSANIIFNYLLQIFLSFPFALQYWACYNFVRKNKPKRSTGNRS